ncbi:MAG TPA: T9SS type A sorting domain-containing protein [Chitinophagaceae bacterium]|nr:T9SS type A sorting domain-containing protein [Chitinophagaceae bacterium]
MKRYVHILLISILPIISFAQSDSTIFAPVGAEWWHGNINLYNPITNYYHVYSKSVGDTIINGKLASKIEMERYVKATHYTVVVDTIPLEPMYVSSTEDTVFIYNTYFDDFTPLYVFNVEEGDTLCLPVIPHPYISPNFESWYNPIAEKDSFFCIIIDSIRMGTYGDAYFETIFTRDISEINTNHKIKYPAYNFAQGYYKEPEHSPGNKNGYARNIGTLAQSFAPAPIKPYWVLENGMDTISFNFYQQRRIGFRCYKDDIMEAIFQQCNVISSVNIEEQQNNPLSLNIYPNPANEKVEISFDNFEKEAIIELYDINGRLIKTYKTSQATFEINTSSFNNGIYLIKVQTGAFTQTQKLSIIH